MAVEKVEVKKELKLGDIIVKPGMLLNAVKVGNVYQVFLYTGWWKVPAEYFES